MASPRTRAKRGRARETEQDSGFFGRMRHLIRDTITEIKKVTWPDQETTRNLTIFVVALSVVLGAMLGGIDAIFVRVWENIPTL